jgi:hypothetical protein
MNAIAHILTRMVAILEDTRTPFMIGGSFASTIHGTARATQDIDVIIEPPNAEAFDRLLSGFTTDRYYLDQDTARRAFRLGGMFNVIDQGTGWKIDFILRKDRAFSESEFARRTPAQIRNVPVFIATAEDTIIAKLEWSKQSGGSSRQRRDVSGIVTVVAAGLDQEYLQHWIAEIGLEDEWQAANALVDRDQ